jgi:hypothetical protein
MRTRGRRAGMVARIVEFRHHEVRREIATES